MLGVENILYGQIWSKRWNILIVFFFHFTAGFGAFYVFYASVEVSLMLHRVCVRNYITRSLCAYSYRIFSIKSKQHYKRYRVPRASLTVIRCPFIMMTCDRIVEYFSTNFRCLTAILISSTIITRRI